MEKREINGEVINSVLQYAAKKQALFTAGIEAMNGYKTITTFYSDLTIADLYGPEAVKDTYKRVNNKWRSNYEYYTEFVLCLNHKIWEHYEAGNEELARVYNDLWIEADDWVKDNYKGEAYQHYFNVTD